MAIASITDWLKDAKRNYKTGFLLYEQYGDNKVTLALLRNGSGTYHFKKLEAALTEINKKCNLEPKPIIFNEPLPAPAPSTKESPDFTDAPAKILEIREHKNLMYAQARRLHETIRVMDSREHRLQAGLQLLDLMDKVNESWAIIDDWKENGRIRELQQQETFRSVEALSVLELLKESKNLPTYISKTRKKLADAKTPAAQAKHALKLQWQEDRLQLITKRLKDAIQ